MPELPEVEIARRRLSEWTAGRTIRAVRVPDPQVVRDRLSTRPSDGLEGGDARLIALLEGARPHEPDRVGKRLAWRFDRADGAEAALLAHLGMTGKWVRRPVEAEVRWGRLALDFDEHSVWFQDSRRFGCVTPVDPASLAAQLREGLGPDALNEAPTAEELEERFGTRRAIKAALMDQDRLAGVGNIHAIEALWAAGIHPATPARELTGDQWGVLAEVLPAQLVKAIAAEDADEIAYVEEPGAPNPFRIYGRGGEPCPRCDAALDEARLGGRTTVWCPQCQPSG